MVDLRLHDAGDLAMTLGAAPDLAFGPERMLAQFFDRRMIVIGDQVGEREVRRIEDARLAAEQLEQACGLLDRKSGVEGKRVSVRSDIGGRRVIKTTNRTKISD